jgi:WD40 repeat protein/uncharacterized caspase-like protein
LGDNKEGMVARTMLSALALLGIIETIGLHAQSNQAPAHPAEAPGRFSLKMDQPTPMAEVLSTSFPVNGPIQILTRNLLVKVEDKVHATPPLSDPVGAYISPASSDRLPMTISAFGEVQSLASPSNVESLHSIAMMPNTQVQKVASSNDARVLGVIVHGYAPSPYLLLLIDGTRYTKIVEFSLSEENPTAVRVSGDGSTAAVGYTDGSVRLWDVAKGSEFATIRTLPAVPSRTPMIGASFLDALCLSPNGAHVFLSQADGRAQIIDRRGGAQPVVMQLPSRASTCAFDPSGATIAVGAGGTELLARVNGDQAWSKTGNATPTSSIAFREDGRLLLFADANGMHIRRTESGEAILYVTAHPASSGSEWTAWSPDGRFDGSDEGLKHLRYVADDKPETTFPIDALLRDYFSPGIAGNVLSDKTLTPTTPLIPASASQVVVMTLQGNPGTSVGVAISVAGTSGKGQHASVRLLRNGLLVKRWQDVGIPESSDKITLPWTVRLLPGTNHLVSYSYDDDGKKSADATVDCDGPKTVEPGTLHLLMIGINSYKNNPSLHLDHAEDDANLIGHVFAAQRAQINRQQQEMNSHPELKYSREDRAKMAQASGPVELAILLSDQATRKNILEKIGELASVARPQDTVVIFFAGHGITRNGVFYLPASDISPFDQHYALDTAPEETVASGSISDGDLEAALEPLDVSSSAVILDACESGQLLLASTDKRRGPVDAHGFAQLAFEKGISLLAAAPSTKEAQEVSSIGHGWLTYALGFEGLENGKARVSEVDEDIYLDDLLRYAAGEVPSLIVQHPLLYVRTAPGIAKTLVGMGAVTLQPETGGLLQNLEPMAAQTGTQSSKHSTGVLSYLIKDQNPALITSISFNEGQLFVSLAENSRIDLTRWDAGGAVRKTLALNWKRLYLNDQADIAALQGDGQLLAVDPTKLNTYPLPGGWKTAEHIVMRKSSGIAVTQLPGDASGGSLQGWDIAKDKPLWNKSNSNLTSGSISADGKMLALNFGREVALMQTDSGQQLWSSVNAPVNAPFDSFGTSTLTDDGSLLATAAFGGQSTLTIWNLSATPSNRAIWAKQPHDLAKLLAFAPMQKAEPQQGTLAAALIDGSISVYHWTQDMAVQQYASGGQDISALSFSPDAMILASGTQDGIVSLFDLKAQVLLLRLRWIESAGTWLAQDGMGHFDAPKNLWNQLVWIDGDKTTPIDPSQYRELLATKVLGGSLSHH